MRFSETCERIEIIKKSKCGEQRKKRELKTEN